MAQSLLEFDARRLLLLFNGVGEIAAGIAFCAGFVRLQPRAPLSSHALHLFRCWGVSIIGFGIMTLAMLAHDVHGGASRTHAAWREGTAVATGAVFYHLSIALIYIGGLRSGLLGGPTWVFGALAHLAGFAGFSFDVLGLL